VIGFFCRHILPGYDLEIRHISTLTDTQKTIACYEFGLETKQDLILSDLQYTKNHTLWGWGNEIIILSIKIENLARFIETQSMYSPKPDNEAHLKFSWNISSGEKIVSSYNVERGVVELKMLNPHISKTFIALLGEDNVEVIYR
ncbi:MAG: hypothetical protein LBQ16_00630, partial [Gracilibacteraceae bacterium]|nr:hypothetical protein [Gracilibacteraceae bacterium]